MHTNKPTDLADKEFWEELHGDIDFEVAPPDNMIRAYLETHVAPGVGECIEIGVCPGRYLAVLGQMGYTVHGIDTMDGVQDRLPSWLASIGCKTGSFVKGDFFEFEPDRCYDVVCSFGFIEHFVEWRDVIVRHAQWVREGGLLVITTPNFRGALQQLLHRAIDPVNLDRHNLDSMRPEEWARVVELAGFKILHCGYLGHFDFWAERQDRNMAQEVLRYFVAKTRWLSRCLLSLPHPAYSPFCAMVARRVRP